MGGGTFNEGSVRELAGRGKLVEVRPQMGKQGSKLWVGWGGNSGMAFRVMLELLVAPCVQDGGGGQRRCFRAGLTKRIVAGGEQGWGMVS